MKKNLSFYALTFLFSATYFISYLSRKNFATIIVEMESATGISESALSLAITGSFITYGVGQIISGFFGDRISPKKLVSLGLLTTTLMNFMIPLFENAYAMLGIWCVNGLAQAFMWPPIVKIMTSLFTEKQYNNAVVKVSWGSSAATIVIHLIAPLLISWTNWKGVFIFSGASSLAMLFVWNALCVEPDNIISSKTEKSEDDKSQGNRSIKVLFSLTVLGVMFAIIMQGMLRDGVETWMPSYIADAYNTDNSSAILSGVAIPVFSIFSFKIAAVLYEKWFKNPLFCAGVLFGVGLASALGLTLLSGKNALLSIICMALFASMMHGVNVILICIVPAFFKKYGIVSTASGVLNSCTYVGSAIATYGTALVTENYGWSATLKVWLLVAALGTSACLLCVRPWKRKFMTD